MPKYRRVDEQAPYRPTVAIQDPEKMFIYHLVKIQTSQFYIKKKKQRHTQWLGGGGGRDAYKLYTPFPTPKMLKDFLRAYLANGMCLERLYYIDVFRGRYAQAKSF